MDVFVCGGNQCPKGGEHTWDGPPRVSMRPCPACNNPIPGDCERCGNTREILASQAATCSKCNLDAMTHAMMTGP